MDAITTMFWNDGLAYVKCSTQKSFLIAYRKFKCFYGISPNVCAILWKKIKDKPPTAEPRHFLWSLLFLKQYNKEHVNAAIVGVDEKTFRKWSWTFIYLLAELNVVKWENRLKNSVNSNMKVSLDGTDFRIREPIPFNRKWYSHKFKGPGIRYEIGISIGSGDVVWASGGLPCGDWPDLKIAEKLYLKYSKHEVTLADKGYRLQGKFKQPSNANERRILARHETLNARLKQFEILNNRYRNNLKKHPKIFHACINIIQVSIEDGEQLFDV